MKNSQVRLPWEVPEPPVEVARVVAEIGCNHMGNVKIAKELIRHAKLNGAYAAKFQKRCVRELLSAEEYNAAHPSPANSFGETYGAHREYLEVTVEQHRELQELCEQESIVYSTSVWDVTSALEIISLRPEFIKVPSAQNTNTELLKILLHDYDGMVHVSTGMSTLNEVENIVRLFQGSGAAKDRLVLYSCTSGYPVPHHEVALLDIRDLAARFGSSVNAIGFSGHHLGIALDVVAFALGATWIERHFTLDRTWPGTDQAASIEPQGLRRLTRDLHAVSSAWQSKPDKMMHIERVQREKLKYKG